MRISDWSSDVCSSDLIPKKTSIFSPKRWRPSMPDGRISQAGGRRMAIDESMKPQWERERKERGRDLEQAQTLQSGGGGGTYDGMEARVAKLESGVDEIERKSVVEGKSVSVSVDLGGRRILQEKKKENN